VLNPGSDQKPWRDLATKLIIAAEWLALLAAVSYLCVRTLPRAWQKLDTDFPNYYLTARLLHEGYDTDRIYEWIWMQRQKDHVRIEKSDQSVVAFVTLTPFSPLLVWPLTSWEPLPAKHIWIAFNLALLVPVGVFIHLLTSLEWRRIALLIVATFPIHRNLQYGQYYILLLLVFVASLLLYVRKKRVLAGLLLGIAAGLKIFPALFLLYFLRKRDPKAAMGLILGSIAASIISIAIFGFQLSRTYLQQVLPWALRGEGMDPYALTTNSMSSLLHHLFIYEPEWNPHPLLHAPILVALLQPVFQFMMLSAAILLVSPHDMRPRQLRLEWAAYVVSLLVISTMPASYHFTLLILPMAIMTSLLIQQKRFPALALLAVLYLGTCFPLWAKLVGTNWSVLAVLRLWLATAFYLCCLALLWQQQRTTGEHRSSQWVWSGVLASLMALEVGASVHHQQGAFGRSAERVPTREAVILAAEPVAHGNSTFFVSMSSDGYQAGQRSEQGVSLRSDGVDQLALTTVGDKTWVEESGLKSRIVSVGSDLAAERLAVDNAEFPVASPDGKWLAYLRSEHGRSRIWLHDLKEAVPIDVLITPPNLNVFEMSFSPDGSIAFSAAEEHQAPHLFLIQDKIRLQQVISEEARYPAVSPDGQWLAYSRRSGGVWNLWLRRMNSVEDRRITDANCNDVSPSWEADSRTLLFASDCGRAFGLTALYRQRVLP
jgi:hypothetical protein